MGEAVYIASSKGGAGATTCAYRLGCALSELGERTLVLDGDRVCADGLTVSGLDGMNVYTLADAASGACRIKQTVLKHGKCANLFYMPALGCTDGDFIARAAREMCDTFDFVLCDGCASSACGRAAVVTEPYASSVKAADKTVSVLKDGGMKVGLILNKVNGGLVCGGNIMPPADIAKLLRCEAVGVIPEDLSLPLGKICGRTQRAFSLAAQYISGGQKKLYGVTRAYAGPLGGIKKKLRRFV